MSTATASTSNVTLEQSLAPSRTSPDSAAIRSTPASSPTSAAPLSTQRPRKRAKLDRDSLEYALTSGFAGGIAGCVAKTSVAPLDRVKILFQTRSPDYQKYAGTWTGVFRASKDIYAETGVRGLLQGHSATLIRIFPYAAIKFMAYDKIHGEMRGAKQMLMPTAEAETSGRRFLAGSLAGIITTGITYPLELIRVRLAFESHHSPSDRASLLRTIRQIYAVPPPVPSDLPSTASAGAATATATLQHRPRSSITHFYRGIWPTLVGIIPYAGTSFLIWGLLKQDLFPRFLALETRRNHRAGLDLLAGGIAGAIGQTTAYPIDIVRRRMQVGRTAPGAGFWDTAKGVYRQSGWRGFFIGLSIGYLKVVPMNAVSFATWVGMKRVLGLEETPTGKSE
ncbi:hypothetical protein BMF94_6324 [Rhodotorula taiwanensis]|uniref:Mitochondrial thiamine pyrophosphate carrier 1 n=1 Tax=Rhodotorula taiwanensis TaxID=741276 RepID=A0A2S5B1M0_9BASI|nr:hypothetical protein BMF94_6324 [Rhodotorula taiwanensis]